MAIPIAAIAAPILTWLFRAVIVKFFVFTSLFLLLSLVVPWAVEKLLPFIAPDSLTSAFSGISSGMWYFIDLFNLEYGMPLLISAYVARFIIRRLPVIG